MTQYQCTWCDITAERIEDLADCRPLGHEVIEVLDKEDLETKDDSIDIVRIEQYLNTQVLDDPNLVAIILRTILSAYTPTPLNLMIKAPTSEGKTYAATEVRKLFPKDDVLLLGGMSPTALVHEKGILVDKEHNPITQDLEEIEIQLSTLGKNPTKQKELEKKKRELQKETKNLIELSGQVLLFLDTPNWTLWNKLKPILSHDAKEIEFKITDKKNSQLRTKNVVIRGWPAVIYCSAKNEEKYEDWDEIESRFLIVTPNTDVSKYKKANRLTAKRLGIPDFAKSLYQNTNEESNAKKNILNIKNILRTYTGDNPVYNPFYNQIADLLPNSEGNSMRIADRFLRICNLETLVNSQKRCKLVVKNGKEIKYPISCLDDVDKAIDLVHESNSIPPEKIKFFQ